MKKFLLTTVFAFVSLIFIYTFSYAETFSVDGSETFSISGAVTTFSSSGLALNDIEIEVTGSKTLKAKTGRTGNYIVARLPKGGTYTLTPSKPGYKFQPENKVFRNLDESKVKQDFVAELATYSISGRVVVGGKPVRGVLITINNRPIKYYTDQDGEYIIDNLESNGGPYEVSVVSDKHIFKPFKIETLEKDTVHDFRKDITISGRVTSLGQGMPDIELDVNGTKYKTDNDGYYKIENVTSNGDYTIRVVEEKYNPVPESIPIKKITGDKDDANFSLSGQLIGKVTFNGQPFKNAVVTVSDRDKEYKTNAQGMFNIPDMGLNQYYQVSVSSEGYQFSPKERVINSLMRESSYQNFKAEIETHSITISVNRGKDPLEGVDVTVNTNTYKTDKNGVCVVPNLVYGKKYTITVNKSGLKFVKSTKTIDKLKKDEMISFETMLSLSGKVLNNVKPLSNAVVSCGDKKVKTDVNGKFEFKNLEPFKNYSIKVSSENFVFEKEEIEISNLSEERDDVIFVVSIDKKAEAEAEIKAKAEAEAKAKAEEEAKAKAEAEKQAKIEAAKAEKERIKAEKEEAARKAKEEKIKAAEEAKAKAEAEKHAKMEAEEAAKKAKEEQAKLDAEIKKLELEEKAKAVLAEKEEAARKAKEEKERAEAEKQAKIEAAKAEQERIKAEKEEAAKKAKEEKLRAKLEAEEAAKKAKEEKIKAAEEAKAKAEAEKQAKIEAEEAAKKAKEEQAKLDAEIKRLEMEEKAKAALAEKEEAKAKAEAEKQAKIEAAKAEQERIKAEKEEAARKAKEEKLRAKEEKARAEAEAKAKAEAEKQAKIEAEEAARKAKEEQARLDAEIKKLEMEEKAKAEAEAKAKAEAEKQAKIEAEKKAKEEKLKAKAEAEAAKKAKEEQAKLDAEIKRLELEEKARAEAEAKAKTEAEKQAKIEAAKAEQERIKAEKEEAARKAKEEKLRAKLEAEEAARKAKEEKARAEAEAKAEAEAAKKAKEEQAKLDAEIKRLEMEEKAKAALAEKEEAARKAKEEKERVEAEKEEAARKAKEEKERIEAEKQAKIEAAKAALAEKEEQERQMKIKSEEATKRSKEEKEELLRKAKEEVFGKNKIKDTVAVKGTGLEKEVKIDENDDNSCYIEGRVLKGKFGVQGVQVRLLLADEEKIFLTDKNGYYRISDLEKGKNYLITVLSGKETLNLSPKSRSYKNLSSNMKKQNFYIVEKVKTEKKQNNNDSKNSEDQDWNSKYGIVNKNGVIQKDIHW